jgi:hypothetical protein
MPRKSVDPVIVPFEQRRECIAITRASGFDELEIWILADFPHRYRSRCPSVRHDYYKLAGTE